MIGRRPPRRCGSCRRRTTTTYNGIGTRENAEEIPLVGWLVSKVSGIVNSALAPKWGDARRILNEAKLDLKQADPQPHDEIVLFGFSRGAALARKFAAMLLNWKEDLSISFLGVFDTVAAMDGIHRKGETLSSDVVFENGTVHDRVKHAVHILSLDEDRIAFEPTQMNQDPDRKERIEEIWFPGVHSDVGGGYWHDGLSDIALQFMIDRCRRHVDVYISESSEASIRDLLNAQGDVLKLLDVDDILVHENVKGISHLHTEGMGNLYSKQIRKVCVRERDLPVTVNVQRPLIHHSVKRRFDEVPEYRPPALRGLEYDVLLPNFDKSKVRGIAGLRELKL